MFKLYLFIHYLVSAILLELCHVMGLLLWEKNEINKNIYAQFFTYEIYCLLRITVITSFQLFIAWTGDLSKMSFWFLKDYYTLSA